MKTFLVVVWILSSGQLQVDPWVAFDDHESCTNKAHTIPGSSDLTSGRFVFITGCLDENAGALYTGIFLDRKKGNFIEPLSPTLQPEQMPIEEPKQ